MKPTKTYTTEKINTSILEKNLQSKIVIGESTVILDVRPPFDFAVAHFPQAVNVQWTDYADHHGPYPGQLKTDLGAEARRLALLGVSVDTPVVIVGKGIQGDGAEGRLAWTLLYLGVKDVQVAQVETLGLRYSNLQPQPRENAKVWEPKLRSSLLASRGEVVLAATSKVDGRTHILDVRSENEFFSKNRKLQYEVPDLRAINIEWREFFNSAGRPNVTISDRLKAVGVLPTDRILVISNQGLRSGAVTYALLSLGYKNAANFAGGYSELLKTPKSR